VPVVWGGVELSRAEGPVEFKATGTYSLNLTAHFIRHGDQYSSVTIAGHYRVEGPQCSDDMHFQATDHKPVGLPYW
jgi:hypothetical protein